jgi:hypothetical protein
MRLGGTASADGANVDMIAELGSDVPVALFETKSLERQYLTSA